MSLLSVVSPFQFFKGFYFRSHYVFNSDFYLKSIVKVWPVLMILNIGLLLEVSNINVLNHIVAP